MKKATNRQIRHAQELAMQLNSALLDLDSTMATGGLRTSQALIISDLRGVLSVTSRRVNEISVTAGVCCELAHMSDAKAFDTAYAKHHAKKVRKVK